MRGDLNCSDQGVKKKEDTTVPVLLVFNKADSVAHVDKPHLEAMFCVEELLADFSGFNFVYVSALANTNCAAVTNWLS